MPVDREHCPACMGYADARAGVLGGVSYHQIATPGWREAYQRGVRAWFLEPGTASHPDNPALPIDYPDPPSHAPTFGTPAIPPTRRRALRAPR